MWVGDERCGAAPCFGMVLLAGAVSPALNALPALIAVVAGMVIGRYFVTDVVFAGVIATAIAWRSTGFCSAR